MAYVSGTVNGRTYQGDSANAQSLREGIPMNFLALEEPQTHSTQGPFSIMLTVVQPDSPSPFRLHMMMPGMSMFTALNEQEYRSQVLRNSIHRHNTYELVYVREGEFYQQIENQRHKYTQRSCCLLNRNVRHREEYTTPFSVVNISLSPEFLLALLQEEPFFREEPRVRDHETLAEFFGHEFHDPAHHRRSYIDFIPQPGSLGNKDRVHDLLDRLTELILAPAPGGSFLIRGLICQILYALSDSGSYTTVPIELGTGAESRIFARITERMTEKNGRISREALARELNYSGSYLNRIVHTYTGMSLSQYGLSLAMERAAWLLTHTDKRVTQIMEELEFTDRTHFYRIFREHFGTTPKQYRDKGTG